MRILDTKIAVPFVAEVPPVFIRWKRVRLRLQPKPWLRYVRSLLGTLRLALALAVSMVLICLIRRRVPTYTL